MVRLVACKISCGNEILIYYCYVIGRWISVSLCQLSMFCPLSRWFMNCDDFSLRQNSNENHGKPHRTCRSIASPNSRQVSKVVMDIGWLWRCHYSKTNSFLSKTEAKDIWLREQNLWLVISKVHQRKKLYQQCDHCQQVIVSGRCDSKRTAHKRDSILSAVSIKMTLWLHSLIFYDKLG